MEGQFLTWQTAIVSALTSIGGEILAELPNILAAIIVLFIGLCLASLLGKLVGRVIEFTKLDIFLHKTVGFDKLAQKGMKISAQGIVSWVVKWFLIIVTFIAVADILKWPQITSFFNDVAHYLPKVIIAVLVLLAGFILGGGLQELVVKTVKASNLPAHSVGLIGAIARWSVIIFSIMAALIQLGIATDLIKILFTGLVGMLALAGGLAFGLGGRDHAAAWLDKVQKEIKK